MNALDSKMKYKDSILEASWCATAPASTNSLQLAPCLGHLHP